MVMKKLIVKKRGGYIRSVENPNVKKTGTVYLVQRGDYTGWTPVHGKNWKKVRGVRRGRTEVTAVNNVLKKGYRKVEFAD